MKVSKYGGPAILLAGAQARPTGIAVDESHVYWVTAGGDGKVLKTPK